MKHNVSIQISRLPLSLVVAVALLLAGLSACSSEAEVFDAPKKTDIGTAPEYNKCSAQQPCDPGLECVNELCTPRVVAPEDAGQLDSGTPDVVEDVGAPVDIDEPTDEGPMPSDPGIEPPDEGVVPDPGPDLTQPDTGPPPPDECPKPGAAEGCDDFSEPCRIVESGALMCVESTVFKTFGAPCSEHSQCDVLYGCHFGVCTIYCELLFGASTCANSSPAGETWVCNNVGHPMWGACGPQ